MLSLHFWVHIVFLIWCTTLPESFFAFCAYRQAVAHLRCIFPRCSHGLQCSMIVLSWKDSSELPSLPPLHAVCSNVSGKPKPNSCQFWRNGETYMVLIGTGLFIRAMSWTNVPKHREHGIWSENEVFLFICQLFFLRTLWPLMSLSPPSSPDCFKQPASAFCAMFLSNKIFVLFYFLTCTKAAQTKQTALERSGNCWGAEWCHIIKSAHYEKRTNTVPTQMVFMERSQHQRTEMHLFSGHMECKIMESFQCINIVLMMCCVFVWLYFSCFGFITVWMLCLVFILLTKF